MADPFMHTVLTPAVFAAERHYYGRTYPAFDVTPEPDAFTAGEVEFISQRDSFSWPPSPKMAGRISNIAVAREALRVTGPSQLMFADHGGNRQMISVGSLAVNDRVNLFLMDYPARERLKILGHAKVLDAREHPRARQLGSHRPAAMRPRWSASL